MQEKNKTMILTEAWSNISSEVLQYNLDYPDLIYLEP